MASSSGSRSPRHNALRELMDKHKNDDTKALDVSAINEVGEGAKLKNRALNPRKLFFAAGLPSIVSSSQEMYNRAMDLLGASYSHYKNQYRQANAGVVNNVPKEVAVPLKKKKEPVPKKVLAKKVAGPSKKKKEPVPKKTNNGGRSKKVVETRNRSNSKEMAEKMAQEMAEKLVEKMAEKKVNEISEMADKRAEIRAMSSGRSASKDNASQGSHKSSKTSSNKGKSAEMTRRMSQGSKSSRGSQTSQKSRGSQTSQGTRGREVVGRPRSNSTGVVKIYPIPPDRQMGTFRESSGQPGSLSPRSMSSMSQSGVQAGVSRSRSGSLTNESRAQQNMDSRSDSEKMRQGSNSRSGSGRASTFV